MIRYNITACLCTFKGEYTPNGDLQCTGFSYDNGITWEQGKNIIPKEYMFSVILAVTQK